MLSQLEVSEKLPNVVEHSPNTKVIVDTEIVQCTDNFSGIGKKLANEFYEKILALSQTNTEMIDEISLTISFTVVPSTITASAKVRK